MSLCTHCDEEIVRASFNADDLEHANPFCCEGCLTVFNVIHKKGFEAYYTIKKKSELYKRRSPVELREFKFNYLDDPDFCADYSYPHLDINKTMQFYLEGIHCLGCLWLIEKIPEFLTSVLSCKLEMERSVVTVVLRPEGKFSEVAEELSKLGYRPHPLKINQESESLKTKEYRRSLYRIGIAGASAGNIMIYAVSLYAGAEKDFSQLFNSLTVLFAIPVLTYSAFPFYKNAWHALRNRTVSIDVPISIALIIGGLVGVANLFRGIPENYFDSLTTLVFLLLLSRFFLQKVQEMSLSSQDLHFFYLNENVHKVIDSDNNLFEEIHPSLLKRNDLILIKNNEFIPADGIVVTGHSEINNSLLTGESLPASVSKGDRVYSGTQNLSSDLVIRVEEIQKQTRLGKILKSVEDGWFQRSKIVTLTNQVSKYFTLFVCLLSFGLFLYTWDTENLGLAFEKAITLLIVTCPCALALAVPLTFTRALSEASRHGIIVKSDEVLERIAQVEHLFLDKTGTITHGKLELCDFLIIRPSYLPIKDIIFNLEARSSHPVAIALKDFIRTESCQSLIVSSFKETFGVGVSGKILNHLYSISKEGIFENSELIATFKIKDQIRSDSKSVLSRVMKSVKSVHILSGDNLETVRNIASSIHLPLSMAHGNLKPEEKSLLVRNTQKAMMVGDGANDAIALSHASVGVAVFGAVDISLRAADVFLSTPGLGPVEKLLTLSQETMKVVRRNLVLSLLYNSLSVAAVFMGIINPLVAAIIMPLSSLTVLVSSFVGTKKSRNLWKS